MLEWGYYITSTSDEASLQWRCGDGGWEGYRMNNLQVYPLLSDTFSDASLMLQKPNK